MGRVLCVALLIALPAVAQTSAPERSADAAAIRAHIESIFQAFTEKDRTKLEETHGANWRGFTPWSGRVIRGRDDYMRSATFPEGMPKGQGMVAYRISDFDVVFFTRPTRWTSRATAAHGPIAASRRRFSCSRTIAGSTPDGSSRPRPGETRVDWR